jgi:hypothetical protein
MEQEQKNKVCSLCGKHRALGRGSDADCKDPFFCNSPAVTPGRLQVNLPIKLIALTDSKEQKPWPIPT